MSTKLVNGVRTNLTAQEEIDRTADVLAWETDVKPVKERLDAFNASMKTAQGGITDLERDVLIAMYNEIKRWEIDNTASTPLLTAAKLRFPSQTKVQVATRIVNKVEGYLTNAAIALANKIKADES